MYGEVTPAESVDLAGGYPQQQFGDLVRLRPRPADGLLAAPGSLRSAVGEDERHRGTRRASAGGVTCHPLPAIRPVFPRRGTHIDDETPGPVRLPPEDNCRETTHSHGIAARVVTLKRPF